MQSPYISKNCPTLRAFLRRFGQSLALSRDDRGTGHSPAPQPLTFTAVHVTDRNWSDDEKRRLRRLQGPREASANLFRTLQLQARPGALFRVADRDSGFSADDEKIRPVIMMSDIARPRLMPFAWDTVFHVVPGSSVKPDMKLVPIPDLYGTTHVKRFPNCLYFFVKCGMIARYNKNTVFQVSPIHYYPVRAFDLEQHFLQFLLPREAAAQVLAMFGMAPSTPYPPVAE